MSVHIPFDNSYARLPDRFFTKMDPTPVARPEMLAFNKALAAELGLKVMAEPDDLAAIFAGNRCL